MQSSREWWGPWGQRGLGGGVDSLPPHQHLEATPSPWPMDEEKRVCPSDQWGGL